MYANTLQATSGNKNQLLQILGSYWWKICRENIKKIHRFLIKNAQTENFSCNGITLTPGQYHSSHRLIADDIKLTDSIIKTALKALVKLGLITVEPLPSRKGSIITILNFDCYSEIDFIEPEAEQDWSKSVPANPIKKAINYVANKVVDKVNKHRQLSPDDYDIRQVKNERESYKFIWTTEAEDHELIDSVYGDAESLRIAKEDLNDYLKRKNIQFKYKDGHFHGLKAGTPPHDKYMKRQASKKLTESRNNIQAANAAHVPVKSDEPPMDPESVAQMVKDFIEKNPI